ncbi:MAG: glycosyltransferase [Candidatus Tritonobacter lacicola]|nr:glycosyltransferase [Candidatus Tritonobacter lacicola]
MTGVVLIIDSMSFGGSQGHVLKLALNLPSDSFDVRVLCLEEKGVLGEELERKGVRVTALGLSRLYGLKSFLALLRLSRLLRREKTAIVQSFLLSSRIFGTLAARIAGVPVIACGVRGEAVGFRKLRHRFFTRLANRWTTLFIANSEAMKKRFPGDGGIDGGKVIVIENGVDLERFRRRPSQSAFRRRLGFSPEDRVVGYAGSLIPVKRVDVFLDAAREVSAAFPAARFLVVGSALPHIDPAMGQKLRARAEELGIASRVIFVDFQPDMPRVYSAMDLLVLPSESEGMSNTLLEAMAMSLPVIASDIGANREVVSDGRNGYLFPVGDHGALAGKIMDLLGNDDLARRFGDESRRIAEESFDLNRMVRNTAEVYRRALKEEDSVTGYFDRKAREFDAIYSGEKSLPGRLLDRLLRWDMIERMNIVLRTASETGAGRILDVGCGSGRIAIPLAERTSARVTGIDTAPRMIDMAGEEASAAGVGERCTFRVGDIFSVSPDDRYDMSIAIGLFDYIFEPLPILKRMGRVTGGLVVASFPRKNLRAAVRKIRLKICGCPVRFFSRKEVEKLFADAGLDIVDFKSVGNLYIVRAKQESKKQTADYTD